MMADVPTGRGHEDDADSMRIREASSADVPFLTQMLYEAANWREGIAREVSISRPDISKYVQDWGALEGDFALVAEDEGGAPVGAAWYRYFSQRSPGFGHVADDIPELTVAVEAHSRGEGIGRALIDELIDQAARAGISALSLSVEEDNPALALYLSCGFKKVGTIDNAWTMRRDLDYISLVFVEERSDNS